MTLSTTERDYFQGLRVWIYVDMRLTSRPSCYNCRKYKTLLQVRAISYIFDSKNRAERNAVKYTVNVDIFACINFHEFAKMGNFACIEIRVLSATGSIGYYKSNFRGVHIFPHI